MTDNYKKPDADDLKARLRELRGTYGVGDEAANCIEQLEQKCDEWMEAAQSGFDANMVLLERAQNAELALTQSQAEVAAAYDRAAEMCDRYPYVEGVKTAIRALATPEQAAALDTIRAEARAQGMREAAVICRNVGFKDHPDSVAYDAEFQILDTITKGAKA